MVTPRTVAISWALDRDLAVMIAGTIGEPSRVIVELAGERALLYCDPGAGASLFVLPDGRPAVTVTTGIRSARQAVQAFRRLGG